MARATKRAGFGYQRGSINPRITISIIAPTTPAKHDIWIDISGASAVLKYWDGSAWQT